MKTKFLVLFASGLLFFGCSNSSDNKTETSADTTSHNHSDENSSIELNNGAKWKVDSNMMVYIRNMETDVTEFQKSSSKNYGSLAEKLQQNIDGLTSSCTMKGKAHDELHKWLLPYIALVKVFSDAKDETDASNHFKEIQDSFVTFHKYFE